ncbi:unnamed protein product [Umbelopsis ramanniana]
MSSSYIAHVPAGGSLWSLGGEGEMTMPTGNMPDLFHTRGGEPRKSTLRSRRKKASTSKTKEGENHHTSDKSVEELTQLYKLTGLQDASEVNDGRPNDVMGLEEKLQGIYQRIEKWAMNMISMSRELDFRLLALNAWVDCDQLVATPMPAKELTACSKRLFTEIIPSVKSKGALLRLVCYAYDPYMRPCSFTRLYNLMITCEYYRDTDLLQSEITSAIAPTIRSMVDGLALESPSPYLPDHEMTVDLILDLKDMLQEQYNWDPVEKAFSGPFDLVRFSQELALASELFLPHDVHLSIWRQTEALDGVNYFDQRTWPLPEAVLQGASEQCIMRKIVQESFTTSTRTIEKNTWNERKEDEASDESEASSHIFDSATEVSGCADITDSDWSIVNE